MQATITEASRVDAGADRRVERPGADPAAVPARDANEALQAEPFDWSVYLRQAPVVAPRVTCEEAAKTFERNPDAECIVVCGEGNEPAGLVMRDKFFRKLSSRFGASLYYERPIARLMDAQPTIVERRTPPQSLLDLALGRDERSLYDCVIVTDGGVMAGVLTVADLLAISRALQRLAAASQVRIIGRTAHMVGEIDLAVAEARRASEAGEQRSETMVDLTLLGKNELSGVGRAFAGLSAKLAAQQEQIDDLQRRANAIGTVTTLIRELAEQCNLLAVNATIEAAHAGEHGRGFAVVADEVRALAAATKRSADDITGLIGGMTEAVRRTAELARVGGKEARGSEEAVERATRAFEELFHAAADSRNVSRDIGAKAEEAHELTARVAAEIGRLADSFRQNGTAGGDDAEIGRMP